jgi:hypothetical protein
VDLSTLVSSVQASRNQTWEKWNSSVIPCWGAKSDTVLGYTVMAMPDCLSLRI